MSDLEVAWNHFNNAVGNQVEAAVYNLKAAEMRLQSQVEDAKKEQTQPAPIARNFIQRYLFNCMTWAQIKQEQRRWQTNER